MYWIGQMPPSKTCELFLMLRICCEVIYVGYDVQLLPAEPLAHKSLLIREAIRLMQQFCVGSICFIPVKPNASLPLHNIHYCSFHGLDHCCLTIPSGGLQILAWRRPLDFPYFRLLTVWALNTLASYTSSWDLKVYFKQKAFWIAHSFHVDIVNKQVIPEGVR